MKMELKKMHPIKSYGQIKIDSKIMDVSFVFSHHFDPKFAPLEQALPRGPQS